MSTKYPDWASEKQVEGMKAFSSVAKEYGDFTVEFTPTDYDDGEHRFYAVVNWRLLGGEMQHTFDIGWYYERTWARDGTEKEPHWQFLFAGGDATREMSTEVFFLELFQFLCTVKSIDLTIRS